MRSLNSFCVSRVEHLTPTSEQELLAKERKERVLTHNHMKTGFTLEDFVVFCLSNWEYLRAAAPAADPGKECEEAGEGQRLRTK